MLEEVKLGDRTPGKRHGAFPFRKACSTTLPANCRVSPLSLFSFIRYATEKYLTQVYG
ncbi:hypothetical protein KCP74_02520 [Salmonella enterica subsp. enterica]|nr:hypothetical protein KCP74_02520 [Salmonella enterica subsp. enterica]